MGLALNSAQRLWPRRVVLLVASLPVAWLLPSLVTTRFGWPFDVSFFPFTLLYFGAAAALWIFGIRPDVLALPLAFSASFFYFSPAAFAFLRSSDLLRIPLILALLVAPIRMVWQRPGPATSWESAYLPSLDGWRAIAILLVVTDHLVRGIADQSHRTANIHLGQHGVNIFFGISGFLITWKLLEEYQQTRGISLFGFYRRRIYRIFPAALAYLSVMGILCAIGLLPTTRLELASTVLYFRNFVPVIWPSFSNAHFWSLSIEEQFYLFLPATLVLLGVRRFRVLSIAMIILCGTWRWYYLSFLVPANYPFSLRYRTDLRLDGLLCGCLMAIILQNEGARRRFRKVLTTPVWIALIVSFGGIIYWFQDRTTLAESLLIPLLLAATVLGSERVPARLLDFKPLRWIGKISYSLYLWQQFFLLCPVDAWLFRPVQRFPGNLIATFACATASYYLLERPMLRRAHAGTIDAQPVLRAAAAAAG